MSTIINCREITISQAEYRALTDTALRYDMLVRLLDDDADKDAEPYKSNYIAPEKKNIELIIGRKLGSAARKAEEEEEF